MVGVERIATNRKYEHILDHRLVGITTIVAQTVLTKNCDHLRSQTVTIITWVYATLCFLSLSFLASITQLSLIRPSITQQLKIKQLIIK